MTARDNGPEVQPFDPEWLVRRGNYLTLITPEIADQLLANVAPNNRRPLASTVAGYARDMAAGRWDVDAADIKVSRTGQLLDGEQRLLACQQAGVPFPTLLRTGLAMATRERVDQGRRRTVGDQLGMQGVADSNNVAAAIRHRLRYERAVAEFGGRQVVGNVTPTTAEALAYHAEHPTLDKFVTGAQRCNQIGPAIQRSAWLAFLSMAAESNDHAAHQFVDLFVEGESSGTGDPFLALTRYLALTVRETQGGFRTRARAMQHILALVRVWSAWRLDEQVDRILVRDSDRLVLPV